MPENGAICSISGARRRRRSCAVVASLPIAIAVTLAVSAGAPGAAGATGATGATPRSLTPASSAPSVTLVTGQQVSVPSDGGPLLFHASGGGPVLTLSRPGGDRYVVPIEALPDVGRRLDWSSFDVSAQARAGSGSAAPDPLGPSGAISPSAALHVVSFQGTDFGGQPATTLALIYDLDSLSRVDGAVLPIDDGVGRVALPEGHFVAIGEFVDFAPGGKAADKFRMVPVPFTVPSTGSPELVRLDERAATSRVSVSTPRPAEQQALTVSFTPQDVTGRAGAGVEAFMFDPPDTATGGFYVAPAPRVPVGRLRFLTAWTGTSRAGASPPYRYDVAFASDDVPADQAHVVRAGQLATVRHHVSTDPAAAGAESGGLGVAPFDPVTSEPLAGVGVPAPAPGPLTEFVGTAAGGQWFLSAGAGAAAFSADLRSFAAGHRYDVDWGHGPQAPGFGQHTGPIFGPCPACTAGHTLTLAFTDVVGDTERDHSGQPNSFTPTFTLSRDGTVLVDRASVIGDVETGISATSGTYRAVFDVDRTDDPSTTQSTRTHTDLTFQYRPDPDPGSAMPSSTPCLYPPGPDSCVPGESAPAYVLPVLSLRYRLASDQTNTSQAAVQVMGLDVGHLTFGGRGSRAPITSVRVEVSVDGGTTWRSATVAGAHGHYVTAWPNAPGTKPWLRVSATDAAGGSITQTVQNAYTVV